MEREKGNINDPSGTLLFFFFKQFKIMVIISTVKKDQGYLSSR